tara:strand:- start:163 stop:699 length:537 start_codon:yes stop_codon:yes gene_type:complete
MKLHRLHSYCIVTDIKEHQEYKGRLLDCINSMPSRSIRNDHEDITATDWQYGGQEHEYMRVFMSILDPYMYKMATLLKCSEWSIDNIWFNKYNNNDRIDWHVHQACMYANTYYLNLPDKSLKTELYDLITEQVIDDVDVCEGQLLTFPAHIIHRSPPNTNKDSKLVISFNSNFNSIEI